MQTQTHTSSAAQQDTNNICSSALSSSSQSFAAATFGLNVCQAAATGTTTGTATAASASASTTNDSGHESAGRNSPDVSLAARLGSRNSEGIMWESLIVAVVGVAVLAL